MLFKKKEKEIKPQYDVNKKEPVIKASICNGEKVAGFEDKETGDFHEVMFIRNDNDLNEFKLRYGIQSEIKKVY